MKWIKCSDQLPDFSEPVLIWFEKECLISSRFNRDKELINFFNIPVGESLNPSFSWMLTPSKLQIKPQYVTFWMPLPESPKEE